MQYRMLLLAACILPAAWVQANDFPTLERVEYVFKCMKQSGGENYDNLYACVCVVDHIAEQMTYADYAEAMTFVQLRSTPGEVGAIFRDPPRADELRDRLDAVTKTAKSACFLKKGS